MAKTLSKLGKVTVIPNYPRLSDFSEPTARKKNEQFVVIYVGGLTERRGIKIILEAIHRLKERRNISLRIVGGFYDRELEKWAHQYDSENELDIDWLGWVAYRELAPVIAASDCGLFVNQPGPRLLKGLPTKIFEYMIMGLPVVSATGRRTVSDSVRRPRLRRLFFESMGFDGVFAATKDYLQPVLAALALTLAVSWISLEDWSETQQAALLVGPVYIVLHLLSGAASKRSHVVSSMPSDPVCAFA